MDLPLHDCRLPSQYYIKNQQAAALAVSYICVSVHHNSILYKEVNRPQTSLLDIYLPDPWHAPVAASTVDNTPDDGRRKHLKHVE